MTQNLESRSETVDAIDLDSQSVNSKGQEGGL